MSVYFPIKVTDWNSEVLRCLNKRETFAVEFEGVYKGTAYSNVFALDQLDIRFSFEVNELIDSDEPFTLEKPLCVLYLQEKIITRSPINGVLLVEFQIVVNTEPQGILKLNGYSTLIKALCDPKRSKRYWMTNGLAPRIVEEAEIIDGKQLLEKLQGRILLRSIIVSFDILGESVYGQ